MRFIYTIGVQFYVLGIRFTSLWNAKAKEWVQGRKNWKSNLPQFENKGKNVFWFHCASLGEFEQGLPVMQAIKEREDAKIIVSFFSPSGYRHRKNHPVADFTFYLPTDTKNNAVFLLNYLKPQQIIFIKYEFWGNLILEAKNKGVKLVLVSGVFRKGQIFFKWYGKFMRRILAAFDTIFVQNKSSQELLKDINVHSIISGDTRYDRVLQNSLNPVSFPEIESFIQGKNVFIAGSVWREDLAIICETLKNLPNNWKVIVAPHNINEDDISAIESRLKSALRYSKLISTRSAEILIIDNIGMLQHLYQYAKIAYVGGGFGSGLHNILEPAIFGMPVIFGNEHKKFPEAQIFIEENIGHEVKTANDFSTIVRKLMDHSDSDRIKSIMRQKTGATQTIVNFLLGH